MKHTTISQQVDTGTKCIYDVAYSVVKTRSHTNMKHVDHVLSTIIVDQMTELTARIHCLVDLLKHETPLISLNITRPSPHSSYFVPQPHQRALICALTLTTVPPNQKSRKCPRCELLLLTSKKQSGHVTANIIAVVP